MGFFASPDELQTEGVIIEIIVNTRVCLRSLYIQPESPSKCHQELLSLSLSPHPPAAVSWDIFFWFNIQTLKSRWGTKSFNPRRTPVDEDENKTHFEQFLTYLISGRFFFCRCHLIWGLSWWVFWTLAVETLTMMEPKNPGGSRRGVPVEEGQANRNSKSPKSKPDHRSKQGHAGNPTHWWGQDFCWSPGQFY